MAFVLGERARLSGYRVHGYDTVGSTNTEAMAAARAGDEGHVWFASLEQTSGRGRRGSAWSTNRGNLAASCLWVVEGPSARLATLGFMAGLSLHDALADTVPDLRTPAGGNVRFALKWPNDVLADGAKLSGILLESEALGGQRHALVTGIGVNVAVAPTDLPYAATSLAELGADCSAEALFTALSEHWCRYEELWAEGRGLPAIRAAWLERAAGLGEPVAVKVGGEVTRGVFETIDEECRLIVCTPAGSRLHVSAGEVHFGGAGSHRGD